MRQKVIKFPQEKSKEVEKHKKRFRCLLPTDHKYELKIIFDKIHRSFVYTSKQSNRIYENVILGSNDTINAVTSSMPANINLHDYSRMFISGNGYNNSESLIKFMNQTFGYRFLRNYNLSNIKTEFGIGFYEDNNQEADHMGWYTIKEYSNAVSLVGVLFYKFRNIKDLDVLFQKQFELNIALTHFDKSNISIKEYPWNRSETSFFDNKLIFYLQ